LKYEKRRRRVKFSKLLLFADDLKIFKKISSIQDCFLLQRDLNIIDEWGACNDMKINVAKCNKMSFFRTKDFFLFDYKIDNFSVNVVQELRDLGVLFDAKLSFVPHIT
jgi:hypothetical protein